ncbi:hypothetical protein SAMN04487948_12533 [Halogranum amylolyticum]|uniref:DUF7575 domain-containing protein n=1 Tax=Halogranum amylolyticum TaxID=660520 RepID=A0A1H8W8B7_9EURY|nr:zinc ribbon domain-containing protein [Halogranum amylolyticum]SEP23916.1 hypothetical protein SAMN04487948_12533 [Halogranum amylolyticum]
MEQRKAKRTWLAVALAIPVVGLGHLYLRRWARAAGWLFLVVVASVFVPPEELEALNATWEQGLLATGNAASVPAPDFLALAPVLVVGVLSIVDAYLVARRHNAQFRAEQAAVAAGDDAEAGVECPSCGREVDPELDFCHWCTTRLQRPDEETTDV